MFILGFTSGLLAIAVAFFLHQYGYANVLEQIGLACCEMAHRSRERTRERYLRREAELRARAVQALRGVTERA